MVTWRRLDRTQVHWALFQQLCLCWRSAIFVLLRKYIPCHVCPSPGPRYFSDWVSLRDCEDTSHLPVSVSGALPTWRTRNSPGKCQLAIPGATWPQHLGQVQKGSRIRTCFQNMALRIGILYILKEKPRLSKAQLAFLCLVSLTCLYNSIFTRSIYTLDCFCLQFLFKSAQFFFFFYWGITDIQHIVPGVQHESLFVYIMKWSLQLSLVNIHHHT